MELTDSGKVRYASIDGDFDAECSVTENVCTHQHHHCLLGYLFSRE
jgi:hypothetical protein